MHEILSLMEGQVRWDYISSQIICKIGEPWNQIMRRGQHMLIREGIINFSLFTQLSHNFLFQSGQVTPT